MASNKRGGYHVANFQVVAIVFTKFESTLNRLFKFKENEMKKLASVLGIGMISMAVALSPAFAQQTQQQTPSGTPSTQSKDVKNEGTTVKPAQDVKAGSTSKPAGTASEMKGTDAKPGANLKTDNPAKSTSASTLRKHHAKKSSGKTASRLRSKTRTSNLDSHGKGAKSESSAPLTGK